MTARYAAVDQRRCAATGFCVMVAPDVFELTGPDGVASVKVDPLVPSLESQAEEAEVTCPTGAISLREGETGGGA